MTCGGCEAKVKFDLLLVESMTGVEVSKDTNIAIISMFRSVAFNLFWPPKKYRIFGIKLLQFLISMNDVTICNNCIILTIVNKRTLWHKYLQALKIQLNEKSQIQSVTSNAHNSCLYWHIIMYEQQVRKYQRSCRRKNVGIIK